MRPVLLIAWLLCPPPGQWLTLAIQSKNCWLTENSVGLHQRAILFTPKCNTQLRPEFAIMPGAGTAVKTAQAKTESCPSYSALVAAEGRPEAVNTESGKPVEDPCTKPGSLPQEARTCPVCGTKFYATADSEFCPVCILRGATSEESASTGESGSVSGLAAASTEEADSGSGSTV